MDQIFYYDSTRLDADCAFKRPDAKSFRASWNSIATTACSRRTIRTLLRRQSAWASRCAPAAIDQTGTRLGRDLGAKCHPGNCRNRQHGRSCFERLRSTISELLAAGCRLENASLYYCPCARESFDFRPPSFAGKLPTQGRKFVPGI